MARLVERLRVVGIRVAAPGRKILVTELAARPQTCSEGPSDQKRHIQATIITITCTPTTTTIIITNRQKRLPGRSICFIFIPTPGSRKRLCLPRSQLITTIITTQPMDTLLTTTIIRLVQRLCLANLH